MERARIVNLYAGVTGGYFRNYHRIAPYNLFANTHVLLREARRRESRARCIGFWFGPNVNGGTTFTYAGRPFRFARGPLWIVLVGNRRAEAS